MIDIKYTARPYLQKRKDHHALCWRVRWCGNTIVKYIGTEIDISKWSSESNRCKKNTVHGSNKMEAASINKIIQSYEDKTKHMFDEYMSSDIVPTREQLSNAFDNGTTRTSNDMFYDMCNIFIDKTSKINSWSDRTVSAVMLMRDTVERFKPDLRVSSISKSTLEDFVEFMCGLDFQNKTIINYVARFKWFIKWADDNGYLTDKSYMRFSMKFKEPKKNIIFLTSDELMRMYNLKLDNTSLEKIRDLFCFSCFTSLRVSDILNLKRSQVNDRYIDVTTIKTNKSVRIELNKYSRDILTKYLSMEDVDGKVFHFSYCGGFLKRLRRIAKEAGINDKITIVKYVSGKRVERTVEKWQTISMHAGRKTFISNALMMGIPPDVVMKWTGHSSYNAMKPYIDITDSSKLNQMSKFNDIFGNSVAK